MDWPAFVPLLLAAGVEWVEAFTIVLAVSLTIGWGAALGAAAAGLGTLTLLTAATGGALSLGLNLAGDPVRYRRLPAAVRGPLARQGRRAAIGFEGAARRGIRIPRNPSQDQQRRLVRRAG